MVVMSSRGWEKEKKKKDQKKNDIPQHIKVLWKSNFSVHRKLYCSTATAVYFSFIYGHFSATMAALSNCDRTMWP